jgi:hypothetical protein
MVDQAVELGDKLVVGLRPAISVANFGHVRRSFGKLVLVMTVLGAIGVETALAEPFRVASAFRKLSCCALNCTMLRGVACRTDCCSPAKHRETPTISARADGSIQAPTLSALPVAATVVIAPSRKRSEGVASVGSRGDPQSLLLQTHTLRL